MKRQWVVINEQHSLLPEQGALLDAEYFVVKVPASGWTYEEQLEVAQDLALEATSCHIWGDEPNATIVFVSPVPALLKLLGHVSGRLQGEGKRTFDVLCFHNDQREKKELPDGRIISVTAKTGWQLV